MYNNNKILITTALILLGSISQLPYADVTETTATIQITATLQDQIRIENLDSALTITGDVDDNGNATGAWKGSTSFKVKRIGANSDNPLPYKLSISSSGSGNGQAFYLTNQDPTTNSALDMTINFTTEANNEVPLSHEVFTQNNIPTRLGFKTNNGDADNITLNFTIPADVIQNAVAGSYSSNFTISVTAQ